MPAVSHQFVRLEVDDRFAWQQKCLHECGQTHIYPRFMFDRYVMGYDRKQSINQIYHSFTVFACRGEVL
jgi:hypothetical protein